MHLVVCATVRKLPLPPRLPKCLLRLPTSSAEQLLQKTPAAESTTRKKKASKKQKEPPAQKAAAKKEPAPRVDLKLATKEFKNGAMKAEEFLPVLEVSTFAPSLARCSILHAENASLCDPTCTL